MESPPLTCDAHLIRAPGVLWPRSHWVRKLNLEIAREPWRKNCRTKVRAGAGLLRRRHSYFMEPKTILLTIYELQVSPVQIRFSLVKTPSGLKARRIESVV